MKSFIGLCLLFLTTLSVCVFASVPAGLPRVTPSTGHSFVYLFETQTAVAGESSSYDINSPVHAGVSFASMGLEASIKLRGHLRMEALCHEDTELATSRLMSEIAVHHQHNMSLTDQTSMFYHVVQQGHGSVMSISFSNLVPICPKPNSHECKAFQEVALQMEKYPVRLYQAENGEVTDLTFDPSEPRTSRDLKLSLLDIITFSTNNATGDIFINEHDHTATYERKELDLVNSLLSVDEQRPELSAHVTYTLSKPQHSHSNASWLINKKTHSDAVVPKDQLHARKTNEQTAQQHGVHTTLDTVEMKKDSDVQIIIDRHHKVIGAIKAMSRLVIDTSALASVKGQSADHHAHAGGQEIAVLVSSHIRLQHNEPVSEVAYVDDHFGCHGTLLMNLQQELSPVNGAFVETEMSASMEYQPQFVMEEAVTPAASTSSSESNVVFKDELFSNGQVRPVSHQSMSVDGWVTAEIIGEPAVNAAPRLQQTNADMSAHAALGAGIAMHVNTHVGDPDTPPNSWSDTADAWKSSAGAIKMYAVRVQQLGEVPARIKAHQEQINRAIAGVDAALLAIKDAGNYFSQPFSSSVFAPTQCKSEYVTVISTLRMRQQDTSFQQAWIGKSDSNRISGFLNVISDKNTSPAALDSKKGDKTSTQAAINLYNDVHYTGRLISQAAKVDENKVLPLGLTGNVDVEKLSASLKDQFQATYNALKGMVTETGTLKSLNAELAALHLLLDNAITLKPETVCQANGQKPVTDALTAINTKVLSIKALLTKAAAEITTAKGGLKVEIAPFIKDLVQRSFMAALQTLLGGGAVRIAKRWEKSAGNSRYIKATAYTAVALGANYDPEKKVLKADFSARAGMDVELLGSARNAFELRYNPGLNTELLPSRILTKQSEYATLSLLGSPHFPLSKNYMHWINALLPEAIQWGVSAVIDNEWIWVRARSHVFKSLRNSKGGLGDFLAPPKETVLRLWSKQDAEVENAINAAENRATTTGGTTTNTPSVQPPTQPVINDNKKFLELSVDLTGSDLDSSVYFLETATSVSQSQYPYTDIYRPRFAQLSSRHRANTALEAAVDASLASELGTTTTTTSEVTVDALLRAAAEASAEAEAAATVNAQVNAEAAAEAAATVGASMTATATAGVTAAVQARHTIRSAMYHRMLHEAEQRDPMLAALIQVNVENGVDLSGQAAAGAFLYPDGRLSFPELVDKVRLFSISLRNEVSRIRDSEATKVKNGSVKPATKPTGQTPNKIRATGVVQAGTDHGDNTELGYIAERVSRVLNRIVRHSLQASLIRLLSINDASGKWKTYSDKHVYASIAYILKTTGNLKADLTLLFSKGGSVYTTTQAANFPLLVEFAKNADSISTKLVDLYTSLEQLTNNVVYTMSDSTSQVLTSRNEGKVKAYLTAVAATSKLFTAFGTKLREFGTALGTSAKSLDQVALDTSKLTQLQAKSWEAYTKEQTPYKAKAAELTSCKSVYVLNGLNWEFCRAAASADEMALLFKRLTALWKCTFIDARQAAVKVLATVTNKIGNYVNDIVNPPEDEKEEESGAGGATESGSSTGSAESSNESNAPESPTDPSVAGVDDKTFKDWIDDTVRDVTGAYQEEWNYFKAPEKPEGSDKPKKADPPKPPALWKEVKGGAESVAELKTFLQDTADFCYAAAIPLYKAAGDSNRVNRIANIYKHLPVWLTMGVAGLEIGLTLPGVISTVEDAKKLVDAGKKDEAKKKIGEAAKGISGLISTFSVSVNSVGDLLESYQRKPALVSVLRRVTFVLDKVSDVLGKVANHLTGEEEEENGGDEEAGLTCADERVSSGYKKLPLFYKNIQIFDVVIGPIPVWGVPIIVGVEVHMGLGVTIESAMCQPKEANANKQTSQFLIVPDVYVELYGAASVGVGVPYMAVGVQLALQFVSLHVPVNVILDLPSSAPLVYFLPPIESKPPVKKVVRLQHANQIGKSFKETPADEKESAVVSDKLRVAVWLKPYIKTLGGEINLWARLGVPTFKLNIFSWEGIRIDLPNNKLCWEITKNPKPDELPSLCPPAVQEYTVDTTPLSHPANPSLRPFTTNDKSNSPQCFPCDYKHATWSRNNWICPLFPQRFAAIGIVSASVIDTRAVGLWQALSDEAAITKVKALEPDTTRFLAVCGESLTASGSYKVHYVAVPMDAKAPIVSRLLTGTFNTKKDSVQLTLATINGNDDKIHKSIIGPDGSFTKMWNLQRALTNDIVLTGSVFTSERKGVSLNYLKQLWSPKPKVELAKVNGHWRVKETPTGFSELTISGGKNLLAKAKGSIQTTNQCYSCNLVSGGDDQSLVCPLIGRRASFAPAAANSADAYKDLMAPDLHNTWKNKISKHVEAASVTICAERIDTALSATKPYDGKYGFYLFVEGIFSKTWYRNFQLGLRDNSDDPDTLPDVSEIVNGAEAKEESTSELKVFQVNCGVKGGKRNCEVLRAPRNPNFPLREGIYNLFNEFKKQRAQTLFLNNPCLLEPSVKPTDLVKPEMNFFGQTGATVPIANNKLCFPCTVAKDANALFRLFNKARGAVGGTSVPIREYITCKYDNDQPSASGATVRTAPLGVPTKAPQDVNIALDVLATKAWDTMKKTPQGLETEFDSIAVCDERVVSSQNSPKATTPKITWKLRPSTNGATDDFFTRPVDVTIAFDTQSVTRMTNLNEIRALRDQLHSARSATVELTKPDWSVWTFKDATKWEELTSSTNEFWAQVQSEALLWSSKAFRSWFYAGKPDLTPVTTDKIGGYLCFQRGATTQCTEYRTNKDTFLTTDDYTVEIGERFAEKDGVKSTHYMPYFYQKSLTFRMFKGSEGIASQCGQKDESANEDNDSEGKISDDGSGK